MSEPTDCASDVEGVRAFGANVKMIDGAHERHDVMNTDRIYLTPIFRLPVLASMV